MLHPSYSDLMKVVNQDVEEGETKIVNSRYSIVLATAKRARQIIDGEMPLVPTKEGEKPLSIAIDELNSGKIKIVAEDEAMAEEAAKQDEEPEEDAKEQADITAETEDEDLPE
ncbi:MAG TPA: DNA-directed RNA polymerase subunit omega [Candidatus Bariatricus faecipullorum]|nr:DNA-directed RNA polymerase subunit omega [Candidatus Bariatricus faecipullorum]